MMDNQTKQAINAATHQVRRMADALMSLDVSLAQTNQHLANIAEVLNKNKEEDA